ncbi:MAG TPA: FtsX-like permease family protein [Polyangiales bacterium]|nr:FtsX-like permease family protein [Polyangiales bacterium]
MSSRRWIAATFGFAASAVLALVIATSWLLTPFRLGRLLRVVSLPRLREHRLRASLTVFGIALGVAMLVAVILVNDSVVRGVSATVEDLAGKTDLQISAGTSGFAESIVERVRESEGVARAVPVLQQTLSVRDERARGERLLLLGVDMLTEDDQSFRDYGSRELDAIREDPLPFLNGAHNILLSRAFASRFGYRLHDKVALATSAGPRNFEIWGFIDDSGVGSAFGGAVGVMYYQAMQAALDRGENVDRIDIAIRPGVELARVEAELQRLLGAGFIVEAPSRKGDRVGRMLLGIQSGLTIASLIALLVGAFLIYNTMAISVVQRKREIGILRALGTRRREIIALLTLEGSLLGVVGSLLGVALGVALAQLLLRVTTDALNQAYLELADAQVALRVRVLLAGSALGTLAATVASAIPAQRAATQRPAETLRTSATFLHTEDTRRLTRSDVAAVLLLPLPLLLLRLPTWQGMSIGAFASAAVLLGACALSLPRLTQLVEWLVRRIARRWLSAEARLANENLPRDLERTAVTAGALMSGVALAVGFGAFTHSFTVSLNAWIEQTLPGDLFITQGASMAGTSMRNIPMDDSLYARLLALPEVDTVRRVRIVEIPFRGYTTKAVSSDLRAFVRHARLDLLQGEHDAVVRALEAGGVAVSENFARHFGVRPGDTLPLSTQLGTRPFRVAGVFVDYTSDVGTLLFDRATYVESFRDTRVDTYELHLHEPSTAEAVRRRIHLWLGENHALYVLTSREFRNEVSVTTDQIFSLVRALELVALIVAVLGIVNSQFANVLDRTRELAVLRALGMLRGQLRRMVVIEATLVGSIGTLAGVLLGFAFGHLLLDHINLVQTGWYFPFRISFASILEVSCLTVPASALAGLYPAAEAARLNITEALESE